MIAEVLSLISGLLSMAQIQYFNINILGGTKIRSTVMAEFSFKLAPLACPEYRYIMHIFGFYGNMIKNTLPLMDRIIQTNIWDKSRIKWGSMREGVKISNCTRDLGDACPVAT